METVCSEQSHINFIPVKYFMLNYEVLFRKLWNATLSVILAYGLDMICFSEHNKAISQPGVRGTQVELQVISDYFSIPVFIGMPNCEGVYHWCVFKPKFYDAFPQDSISSLPMPGYPFSSKKGSHIEIVRNTANSHYDSVIPISKSL